MIYCKLKILFFSLLISSSFSQNEVCLEVVANPHASDPALSLFTKYVNVLDCFHIYAEPSISDYKVLHVASVAAELLDNDENGEVDDPLLKQELSYRDALIPIITSEWSSAANNFFNNYNGDGASAVLFNNEIDPSNPGHWGDDATVEEVVHVINDIGHVSIYPDTFDIDPNSSLMSSAMDVARGGQFINVPSQYPDEAWYHYDDWTCDYQCMAIEYMYWCIVSNMGILDDPQTCNGIDNEWELCTPELFESTDISMYQILTDSMYKLPQLPPDGNYCPSPGAVGDLNLDEIVNVLDVILIVNMVLGIEPSIGYADVNSDGTINILDVIQIVNIILNN